MYTLVDQLGFEILAGIIIGLIILFMIFATISEKFFPKSNIHKVFENIAEWIKDNIRI